jgi:hypothetical protein
MEQSTVGPPKYWAKHLYQDIPNSAGSASIELLIQLVWRCVIQHGAVKCIFPRRLPKKTTEKTHEKSLREDSLRRSLRLRSTRPTLLMAAVYTTVHRAVYLGTKIWPNVSEVPLYPVPC